MAQKGAGQGGKPHAPPSAPPAPSWGRHVCFASVCGAFLIGLICLGAREEQQRKQNEEVAKALGYRELMLSDYLGEAHPLWQAPVLCPFPNRTVLKPVPYPGLSFCPPLRFEHIRSKLVHNANPREYDKSERTAWNAEPPVVHEARATYWMLDAAAFVAVIGAQVPMSKWLLNLGAKPDVGLTALREIAPGEGDDLTQLFPMGYSGVLFELPDRIQETSAYYARFAKAHVDSASETPEQLVGRLEQLKVRKDLDIAKLDIDSFECDFLEALMGAGFRPKVVTIELSSSFPPPLKFKVEMEGYPTKQTRYTPLQGCSLQYAYDILRPQGYTLVQYVVEDAWFVQDEYAPLFGQLHTGTQDLYRLGNPFLVGKWPWPEFHWSMLQKSNDSQAMLAMARQGVEALKALRPGLEKLRYTLEVADDHGGKQ